MRKFLGLLLALALLVLTTVPISSQGIDGEPPLPCPPPSDHGGALLPGPRSYERFRSLHASDFDPLDAPDLPDLNAAFIMQRPRYDYWETKNSHEPGDSISFVAHIANRGSQPTGTFDYEWQIDGSRASSGSVPGLAPSETFSLTLGWTWQSGTHTVRIELDPDDNVSEVSEQNNVVEDRANALSVGFWVEQSVYDWFNENQYSLGLGSVSWDDWAQRQLRVWNQMFADAITPLTPQGVLDRVRLDKVTVVPDGSLPSCATNRPAVADGTVDLQWGFPVELIGIDAGHTCGALNYYIDHEESLDVEYSLMHELSHARYLVDLYGLNVYVNRLDLTADVSSTATTLSVDRDVEGDGGFPLPAYLAVGGELIICDSKVGSAFEDCRRGGEGTTPRSHSAGDAVNLATVRLQDGQGNLVQGSAALPIVGGNQDHLYFNRYPDDLMHAGTVYAEHSAYAWNRIAGQRPGYGNYNPPWNIGEYLNDIPQNNVLEVRTLGGDPIVWARVEVYQAQPFPIWYGKYFDSSPDMVLFTDAQGRANLGAFPFGDSGSIVHTYGESNTVMLLKISSEGESIYDFFEVTETNVTYWQGHQTTATYTMMVDLPQSTVTPSYVFLPTVFNSCAAR